MVSAVLNFSCFFFFLSWPMLHNVFCLYVSVGLSGSPFLVSPAIGLSGHYLINPHLLGLSYRTLTNAKGSWLGSRQVKLTWPLLTHMSACLPHCDAPIEVSPAPVGPALHSSGELHLGLRWSHLLPCVTQSLFPLRLAPQGILLKV